MPWTMGAFTLAALGMIGVPPTAGFVSKWYLATGALAVGETWVIGIILMSTLLNAMYFLPLLHAAWFLEPADAQASGSAEAPSMLLGPPLVTAGLALAAGVFAGTWWSPLDWAGEITAEEYGP